MKFVIMVRDELGEESRAYGTDFLSAIHEFPSFDEDDAAMTEAFFAWMSSVENRAQADWESVFGPESSVFIERLFSDMTLSELGTMCGYDDSIFW